MDFHLKGVPLLSRIGADRADQVRTDVEAAAAGWPDAALLRLDSRNQVMVADGKVLLGKAKDLADEPPPDAVFLGRMGDGRHVWAVRGPLQAPEDPGLKAEVADLRRGGQLFDDVGAQLVSAAAALLNWHASARFSSIDGSPTKPIRAGWARVNPVTGHEEFPRI
ncbi:MAG: diphosphatase, partial [Mycobacterium sp.]|nr:diphosphatase [Mycobacterium sp.]